jgi:hypothetical protein
MEFFNWELAVLTAGVFSNASLVMMFFHLNRYFITIALSIPLLSWCAYWIYYIVTLLSDNTIHVG